MLAALTFVDAVVVFEEDTPQHLIEQVQPDVLVKGGDYEPTQMVGYDTVKARKGEVVAIPLLDNFSTTGLVERLKE